ncbi:MAG: hypothetical protein LBH11_04335 [Propionibacteriaceae bacterium]|jgi:Flp pilus assembly protein TadB|nr:hypothetical protein [Propionibacteriaceae bacterium]
MVEPFVIALAGGGLAVGGCWAVARSFLAQPPRLESALALLDEPDASAESQLELPLGQGDVSAQPTDSVLEARASTVYQRLRLPLGANTRRLLAIQGSSEAGFMAAKLLLASAGVGLPVLFTGLGAVLGVGWGGAPLALSLLLGALGFFAPDLQLRAQAGALRESGAEALSVLFDLVVLERLANASAVQAITAAASAGDGPVFARVAAALEYARLQQRSPWPELHRIADELELSELHDIADIMALDEQGAALAGALRARVREVRHASLLREKTTAQARTEAMTIWMVIPVLVFALIFLIPPLLRLVGAV